MEYYITFADMVLRVVRLAYALVALLLCALLSVRCARVMTPEGGPKDENPPRLVRTKPEPFTVNFTGPEVRLFFDETVTTKEFQKFVEVSPPLRYPLIPTDRGKSLALRFTDTLLPNTTYRVDLSQAIVDLSEGNKAMDCVYVFSTGGRIDSGLVVGTVRDAFTHNPVDNATVQLYVADAQKELDDFPAAAARVKADGTFRLENVQENAFRVAALVDANGNKKYDLPSERIAFLDTAVLALRMPRSVDTLGGSDSVKLSRGGVPERLDGRDSVFAAEGEVAEMGSDTIRKEYKEQNGAARVVLNMFSEESTTQTLLKRERPTAGMVQFVYSSPPAGRVQVEVVAPVGANFIEEHSKRGDTVLLWAQNPIAWDADTLFLLVRSFRNDSLNVPRPWVDTARLGYRQKKLGEKQAEKGVADTGGERLKLEILRAERSSAIKPGDTLVIRTQQPYASVDRAKFRLISSADTSEYPFTLVQFEGRPRDVGITTHWPIDSSFIMVVDSGAVRSFGNNANDSTAFPLRTYRPSNYSALHFTLVNVPDPCILQLYTDTKERKTVRQVVVPRGETKASIMYLDPGTYYLRVVDDRNGDGRWTTGDFARRRQPEAVRYYATEKGESEIKTRANWEYDISVDYSKLEE